MNEFIWIRPLLLPLILGGVITYLLYRGFILISQILSRNTGAKRMAATTEVEEKTSMADFASPAHKLQLVFLRSGIPLNNNPVALLWATRTLIALPFFLLLNLFLFESWIFNLGISFVGSYFLTRMLITMTWMKTVERLEDEILTFNASIRNTFKVIPDVASAVAFECEIFEVSSPLRQWMEQHFLRAARSASGLRSSYRQLKDDAYQITRSLYNCVVLLENVGVTGGNQLDEAYLQTEDDLNIKAHIRDQIQQVVSGTRSQKVILISITIILMIALGRSDLIQASNFAIRIMYVIILGTMMIGWNVVTDMFERTLG